MESLIVNAGSAEEALLAVLRNLAESKSRLNKERASTLEREAQTVTSAQRIEELMQRYGRWEGRIHGDDTFADPRRPPPEERLR